MVRAGSLKGGFIQLRYFELPPTLILQRKDLDGHGVGASVQLGQRLILRDPAAVDFVGQGQLAGFVVYFDGYVPAETLERGLCAKTGANIPDLAGPLIEISVEGHSALEGDWLVLGLSRRLQHRVRVVSFPELHDLGGLLEGTDLADAGDGSRAPLPENAELECLVGIQTMRVDLERGHCFLLRPRPGQPSAVS